MYKEKKLWLIVIGSKGTALFSWIYNFHNQIHHAKQKWLHPYVEACDACVGVSYHLNTMIYLFIRIYGFETTDGRSELQPISELRTFSLFVLYMCQQIEQIREKYWLGWQKNTWLANKMVNVHVLNYQNCT